MKIRTASDSIHSSESDSGVDLGVFQQTCETFGDSSGRGKIDHWGKFAFGSGAGWLGTISMYSWAKLPPSATYKIHNDNDVPVNCCRGTRLTSVWGREESSREYRRDVGEAWFGPDANAFKIRFHFRSNSYAYHPDSLGMSQAAVPKPISSRSLFSSSFKDSSSASHALCKSSSKKL